MQSIMVALDVADINRAVQIVKETCTVEKVVSYKIGFGLALRYGLPAVVKAVKNVTDKKIVYDHQKAATDIPATGELFVEVCKDVDGIILFPQAGPATMEAWIRAVQAAGKTVIVGGEMTHKGYLASDGGFLVDSMPETVYAKAAALGVTHFVVPGNKPERMRRYATMLAKVNPVFYSPGLGAQGGDVRAGSAVVGKWCAIIGRGITQAENVREAAEKFAAQLQ